MSQIKIHDDIKAVLIQDPKGINPQVVTDLISINFDARNYFFANATEEWLGWLWSNGFLDVVKEKAKDLKRYGRSLPELNYFGNMVTKRPDEVVNIILAIPISKENFNPDVIGQFLRIGSLLPAEHLARIVVKMRDEHWSELMQNFNSWGFEYERMFKVLEDAKYFESIIILAETVLSVRRRDEMSDSEFSDDNPFYLREISYTKVFEYLRTIDDGYVKKAVELVTAVLGKIILLGKKSDENAVFENQDIFSLYDIDFFSLEGGKNVHMSERRNVPELLATIKILIQRAFQQANDSAMIRDVYYKHILTLPESRAMWRLKLFIMSLRPQDFIAELRQAFFRIFEVIDQDKNYHEILLGTEYKKTLRQAFEFLDIESQRQFISKVLKYWAQDLKSPEETKWRKNDAWQILSSISKYLTPKEEMDCQRILDKKSDASFEPEPAVRGLGGGFVSPRGPITQSEFSKLTIEEILEHLRNDWKPEVLAKQNKFEDFLNPLNAEGVGKLLSSDIAQRPLQYLQNASSFYANDIDFHYTYSFLKGIQEAIQKSDVRNISWEGLFTLFMNIKRSSDVNRSPRKSERFDTWLSDWEGVHRSMTDVVLDLLREVNGKLPIDFVVYRDQILATIEYLISYPNPKPQDEEINTARRKTRSPDDKEYKVSDPFHSAINSVRGCAFEAFVFFIYQDGKDFLKEDKVKINADVKGIYEATLDEENTRALMFMFGHYLPSFYYRDKAWIRGLLPKIFPQEPDKKHLLIASWEGYLANNLHKEMFFDLDFQELYKKGLLLNSKEDEGREFFKDLDEGIASHLALAFIAFPEEFGFDHPLFKKFWEKNIERQAEFINFIGRMFVSGRNANADKALETKPLSKQRLKDFWQWIIDTYTDQKLFVELGFWINLEKPIFEAVWLARKIKETLEKTSGVIKWEIGLKESIIKLSEVSPKESCEIVSLYLLEGCVRQARNQAFFFTENEWFKALQILYKTSETKDKTYKLIDDLISEGGSVFWPLEEIIK